MASRLYGDLATWWPLFSDPAGYAEEAGWILAALREALGRAPARLMELGSGGGNTASHLAPHMALTLVELSPEMVKESWRINPGADHIVGDMRRVRLGRTFQAVLIHDAIMVRCRIEDIPRIDALVASIMKQAARNVLEDALANENASASDPAGHENWERRQGKTLRVRHLDRVS